MGINPLAIDSDNVTYDNPRGYYQVQRRLKRWQRVQARRTKGSRGWWEAQRRIDSAHRRATGLRNNAHHQVSRALVGKYHTLGIETLNVAGMIRAGLQYPSSKTCSACGEVNKDLGRKPIWTCPSCSVTHDRNENAARNLLKLALLAVGEDVMLLDGEALADGDSTAGETTPVEGRTKPRATIHGQPTLDV